MKILKDDLITVLSQFNPWWRGEKIIELPTWRRAVFGELFSWIYQPPAPRAVLLSGARQVGKTTLLLQAIEELLKIGVPAANILYATFDHPLIKLAGIDVILEAWRMREPRANGAEYLFLDEAQFIESSGTWIKHQVDFHKDRRVIFTGSAMPLIEKEKESGVGRWHSIRLTTLSFYEYLQLKEFSYPELNTLMDQLQPKSPELARILNEAFKTQIKKKGTYPLAKLPQIKSLRDLFNWPEQEFSRIAELAMPYLGHFHQYLLRGGFPQTIRVENINQAQRLLREDIIDKALKRDMTAIFGVRRVLELEKTFLYLCMHDGGLLDIQNLCSNLGVKRPTTQHFIDLLEATHLIYRLQPYGYGKEILRARYKIYLADAAIAPAVLLKGNSMLDDANALGIATETAIFKHLLLRFYKQNVRFSYWQGDKKQEVDLVAEINNEIIPFEIKYRGQHTGARELKGLLTLCQKKSIKHGYLVTKSLNDFGPLALADTDTRIMRIPAALFCYWMGESELMTQRED